MKNFPVRSAPALSLAGILTVAFVQPASAEAPSAPYIDAGVLSEHVDGQNEAQPMGFDEDVSDSAADIEAAIIATGGIEEGPRIVPAHNAAGKITAPDQELVLPSDGDASLIHEGLGLAISLPPESSSGEARLAETGVLVYEAQPGQSASAVAVPAEGYVHVYQDVLMADEAGNPSTARRVSVSFSAKIKSAVARAVKTWQAFKITKGMSASKIRHVKAQRNKALRNSLGVVVAAVLGTDVIIEKCA